MDEVQFDTESLTDLEELWCSFCMEEECTVDSVDYVEKVVL